MKQNLARWLFSNMTCTMLLTFFCVTSAFSQFILDDCDECSDTRTICIEIDPNSPRSWEDQISSRTYRYAYNTPAFGGLPSFDVRPTWDRSAPANAGRPAPSHVRHAPPSWFTPGHIEVTFHEPGIYYVDILGTAHRLRIDVAIANCEALTGHNDADTQPVFLPPSQTPTTTPDDNNCTGTTHFNLVRDGYKMPGYRWLVYNGVNIRNGAGNNITIEDPSGNIIQHSTFDLDRLIDTDVVGKKPGTYNYRVNLQNACGDYYSSRGSFYISDCKPYTEISLNRSTAFVAASNCTINGALRRDPLVLSYQAWVDGLGNTPNITQCDALIRRLNSPCGGTIGGQTNEYRVRLLPANSSTPYVSGYADLWAVAGSFLSVGQYQVELEAVGNGWFERSQKICFGVNNGGVYNVDFQFTDQCSGTPGTLRNPAIYDAYNRPYTMVAGQAIALSGTGNSGIINRYGIVVDEVSRTNGAFVRNVEDSRTLSLNDPLSIPLITLPNNSFSDINNVALHTYIGRVQRARRVPNPNYSIFTDPAYANRTYRVRLYGYNDCTGPAGVFKEMFVYADATIFCRPAPSTGKPATTSNPSGNIVGVTAYPNPSSSDFVLDIENEEGTEAQLLVTDLQGRVIHSSNLPAFTSQHTIPASDWPAGMYIYRLVAGENQLNGKLIKE